MIRTPFVMPLEGASFEQAVATLSRDTGFVAVTARRAGRTSAKNSTHAPAGGPARQSCSGGPARRGCSGGLFSIVASDPSASFSMSGAFVTIDGHTAIDTPTQALERFLARSCSYPQDPYLPFGPGAIGYVGFEGSCALAGFEPAKGFSRFPQAHFGIYETIAIFDHAEKTASVVSAGETESAAAKNANALVERISASPVRQSYSGGPARENSSEGTSWRVEPDDTRFAAMLKEASLWLNAEIVKSIHVARNFTKPAATENALHDFLAPENISSVRAIFGHEGAFAFAVSNRFPADGPARRGCSGGIATDEILDLISDPRSGGDPSQNAASFIRAGEDFHRGLYGGTFGLLNSAGAKFYPAAATKFFADGTVKILSGMDVTHDTDLSSVPQQISRAAFCSETP